ncbi:ABC transporter permease [Gordonia sp. B21]|nr:ABC transporter permease [Gordonia paraffinivorans]MCD2144980.1 ABC transporter permease [Gordonia paraffinivorans]
MAGHQATFVSRSLGAIPHAALHYRRHIAALIGDMTLGSSGIIVGGGTLAVLAFLGVAVGASIGIQGYALLDMVNMGPLTGLVSAYASTRELAPMIAAVGFAAQTGCRITAEIGSMRISEEVDALEANGIRSIPFVVSTRMVAGAITIVPLYLIALILGYVSCAFVVIVVHGESDGAYQHYFGQFISGSDIVYSVVKAVVFVVLIILIHSYFGYFASGGPEGVGVASGRAIRASLVVIVSADMVLTLMFWGLTNTIAISG